MTTVWGELRCHQTSTKPSDNWEENFASFSSVSSRDAPGPQLLTSRVFVQGKLARRDKARQTTCTVLCWFFFLEVCEETRNTTTAKHTSISPHEKPHNFQWGNQTEQTKNYDTCRESICFTFIAPYQYYVSYNIRKFNQTCEDKNQEHVQEFNSRFPLPPLFPFAKADILN